MERFTRAQVKELRAKITDAINDIVSEYGSVATLGTINFNDTITTKLTISRLAENEHGTYVHSKEAKTFLRLAVQMGLSEDVLNEPCVYLGDTYVVTGYNSRAKKYPINFTKNGNQMKCSVDFMKKFVKAERPELFL